MCCLVLFQNSVKFYCCAKCTAEISDFDMENLNVLKAFEKGGRSPECHRKSKEMGQLREKTMYNNSR